MLPNGFAGRQETLADFDANRHGCGKYLWLLVTFGSGVLKLPGVQPRLQVCHPERNRGTSCPGAATVPVTQLGEARLQRCRTAGGSFECRMTHPMSRTSLHRSARSTLGKAHEMALERRFRCGFVRPIPVSTAHRYKKTGRKINSPPGLSLACDPAECGTVISERR